MAKTELAHDVDALEKCIYDAAAVLSNMGRELERVGEEHNLSDPVRRELHGTAVTLWMLRVRLESAIA